MLNLSAVHKSRGVGAQRYSLVIPALHLRAGEQVAIVGPSGCGKSTLLDLLALVLAPDQVDRFEFNQADIGGLWRADRQTALAELRSRHLGYVLQTGGLLGFLDVRSNIALSRQLLGLKDDGSVTRLAEQLTLLYSEYNQSRLPWIAADFPALRPVLIAPTQDRLDSLARHYASVIALGNRDALHALGKGATPHEQFLARRQSVSTGRYLQRLFSNLIPGLSCLNPEDGSDALACVLDIAALKGAAVTLGGRAFKPLAKLPGVLGQSANTARLNAARARIDALLDRLPASATEVLTTQNKDRE